MGLSLKYFIYDEETDEIKSISTSKFEKLFNFDPLFSLKEYSGRKIKYISVVVQLENRKPVSITNMQFHIMKIDQAGMFDREFMNELELNIGELVDVPLYGLPENVIDKSADFAAKKYKQKYSWTPSVTLEKKIKEIIFGKSF